MLKNNYESKYSPIVLWNLVLPNRLSQAGIAQEDGPRRYRKATDDYCGPVEVSKEAGVECLVRLADSAGICQPQQYFSLTRNQPASQPASQPNKPEVIPQVHLLPHLPHPLLHLPHHCLHLIVCWLGLSGSPSSRQLLEACAMTDQGS